MCFPAQSQILSLLGRPVKKGSNRLPAFLITGPTTGLEVQVLAQRATPYWDAVRAAGFLASAVDDVRFDELGEDFASPLKSSTPSGARLCMTLPSESKLLALARYLIEHVEHGRQSPMWRERLAQFEQRDMAATLTPLAAKAVEDQRTRSIAAKAPRSSKLPSAEELHALIAEKRKAGDDERTAKSKIVQKYGVSSQALNKKLKRNLAS